MNLQHVTFKVFVEGELSVDWEQFINVFHGWVASQSMPEMMVDVADYRHVPNGPGVVMSGLEADYFMDNTDGQPGLKYVGKAGRDGSNEDRIKQAIEAATSACSRLEAELSGVRFSRTNFELSFNDRAFIPNNADTQAYLAAELPSLLSSALSGECSIEIESDARKLAGARIQANNAVEFAEA